jgi:hypothetical protein
MRTSWQLDGRTDAPTTVFTSGGSGTVPPNCGDVVLNGVATTFALTFPVATADKQYLRVMAAQQLLALRSAPLAQATVPRSKPFPPRWPLARASPGSTTRRPPLGSGCTEMGTWDAKNDGKIFWNSTLALLIAAMPNPQFPPGTMAYTSDFGWVSWNANGYWENNTANTFASNTTVSQAAGTLLTSEICNMTAGAAGACTLPPSVPGQALMVHNISGFNITVFPSAGGTGSEKINSLAANAGIVMATNTSTTFTCCVAGQWYTVPRVPS